MEPDPFKIERDRRMAEARAREAAAAGNAKRRVRLNPPFPYAVRVPDLAFMGFPANPVGDLTDETAA